MLHRSSAVAAMLQMPVATLRVWERRYRLTKSQLSPGGQRLYSDSDVQRLVVLKRLTEIGHAIGSLAPLDMAQLEHVAATHAQALARARKGALPESTSAAPVRAWRVALIGSTLASRMHKPALLRRLNRPLRWFGPFDLAAQAAIALNGTEVDAVLIHVPSLHEGWLTEFLAAAPSLQNVPIAVLYGFAADSVCETLASAGVALLREPQPDAVLAQWLRSLLLAAAAPMPQAHPLAHPAHAVPPRRWDDAALAQFAGQLSTIACECPRQLAELLVQLSHFESYSRECADRSPADAELHAYLSWVAATSRAQFEAALECVALHEGLVPPAPSRSSGAVTAPGARRAKSSASGRTS